MLCKNVIFTGVSFFFGLLPFISQAQDNNSALNRQMEVTRAYEPTVNEADKLDIKPNMVDTVDLKPEISYSITPTPISYGFETAPIKVANINTTMYRNFSPFYIKAGFGYPLRSLLDFYYSSAGESKGKWGAYVNHTGQWSKIKNDNGWKVPASRTDNKVGVFGDYDFGRLGIDGGIGYDYDMVTRYGYKSDGIPLIDTTASALRQNFSTIKGNFNFGHSFEDLSYFNFRLGASAAYFQDKFDMGETDVKAYLALGKLFNGMHEITLKAQYEGYKGNKDLIYADNMISATPLYRLVTDKFNLALGCTFTYDNFDAGRGDNNKTYFFPKFNLKFDIANGYFVPFVEIDGMLRNNGYRNTVAQNPYVVQGLFMPNTEEYNGRAGITGSISSAFSYKVFVGMSLYKNLNMFVNMYDLESAQNLFSYVTDNANMFTIGGDLEGRISGSFGIQVAYQYYGYDMKHLEKAGGMPNMTGRIALKFNSKDKFIISAGADLIGRRFFYEYPTLLADQYDMVKMDAVVDLNLKAEYNVSKVFGVFLDLDNLLNRKLYPYNHYPDVGIGAMAGIKLAF